MNDVEVIICPKCGAEFDLQYHDDVIVSCQPCKCRADYKTKPLDKARELLNEINISRSGKVSITAEAGRKDR